MSKEVIYLSRVLSAYVHYYGLKKIGIFCVESTCYGKEGNTKITVDHSNLRYCFNVPFPMTTEDIKEAFQCVRREGVEVLYDN